jgi:phosphoribosylformimino-5-aminoimidazole carboxamide ribotide isomerase
VRIIPVIDVMGGVVVRAVGGRREEYRPIRSRLTDSTDPVQVAEALLRVTGSRELYVADLDAITGGRRNPNLYAALHALGCNVWLDAGYRVEEDYAGLEEFMRLSAVFGSESGATPSVVRRFVERFGADRGVISIDLAPGTTIGNLWSLGHLPETNWPRLAGGVLDMGARRVIVLDLWRVGTNRGVSTGEIAGLMKRSQPSLEVITGGGVRDWDDVKRLEDAGADAVLVASSLHDGTLTFPRPTS